MPSFSSSTVNRLIFFNIFCLLLISIDISQALKCYQVEGPIGEEPSVEATECAANLDKACVAFINPQQGNVIRACQAVGCYNNTNMDGVLKCVESSKSISQSVTFCCCQNADGCNGGILTPGGN